MKVESLPLESASLNANILGKLREAWNPYVEKCGLILRDRTLYPIRNASLTPDRYFEFDVDQLEQFYLHENPNFVLGVYHTHPGNSPRPSKADIAGWPTRHGLHYWIVTEHAVWEWAKNNDGTAYLVYKSSMAD